jgi:hypothetical protein
MKKLFGGSGCRRFVDVDCITRNVESGGGTFSASKMTLAHQDAGSGLAVPDAVMALNDGSGVRECSARYAGGIFRRRRSRRWRLSRKRPDWRRSAESLSYGLSFAECRKRRWLLSLSPAFNAAGTSRALPCLRAGEEHSGRRARLHRGLFPTSTMASATVPFCMNCTFLAC